MTAYHDLEPCDYFDSRADLPGFTRIWSDSLRSVGWLGSASDFPCGQPSPEVLDALRTLTASAWQPMSYFGSHYCGLCVKAAGEYVQDFLVSEFADDKSRAGSRNLFIPGYGVVYAAPELILHYIAEHHYQPPAEFCAAVLTCPTMNSAAYFAALRRNATGDFARMVPRAPWWRFWNREPELNEEFS